MTSPADATKTATPSGPAARYEMHEELGRGGMACVYRATDRALSRQVALKQLTVHPAAPERLSAAALFEREYHTLMQLRHPHVIAVYDYGVRPDGAPFYTMELLDGGDLRERSPMNWREASRLVFDVCSALALLHSRRLLHRDISPRNIRCTQAGQAKLIDFGAMAPMSTSGTEVVGTPAFTAPETLQRLATDARTDLYSLGVTLYYGLTARLPYSARTFADLVAAWGPKPVRPSAIVTDIPPALDDLVLSLISVEPSLRPASAFEVMQRLAACAGLRVEESEAVSRAYLSTPTLVGREHAMERLRELMRESRLQRVSGVMIEGGPGTGRSRLLDACALDAQTRGFTVLRATASGTREPFSIARALATHLISALGLGDASTEYPELFVSSASAAPANDNTDDASSPALLDFSDRTLDPARLQRAMRRWLLAVSRTHPLLIAVDDVHKIDQPSAALLAELIDRTKRGGILVALTADNTDERDDALSALSRRCNPLPLAPLTSDQTLELFSSLFGEVANLPTIASEIHRVALGNPGQSLEMAQHLVDRGVIRYASGNWTLPRALSADDLPRTAAAAMQARIGRMSPHAQFLGAAHALAFSDTLSEQDYRGLAPDVSSLDFDLALSELLTNQAIVRDGDNYTLANRVWTAAFLAGVDAEQTRACHTALAAMYAAKQSVGFIHHAFCAGLDQQGLEALDQRNNVERTEADYQALVEQNVSKMMWCYPRAIAMSRALGRGPRDQHDLRRWQYLGSMLRNEAPDRESAQLWYEQLAHDSGLMLYRADTQSSTPAERLTRALQAAQERYLATPEHERVYPVDEAIRLLGEYVVVSIGVGGRTLDTALVRNLPEMIEPFVPLSPLLETIWTNSVASRASHCECKYERAREVWMETLSKLDGLKTAGGESFLISMGNAIAHAIALMETQLGLPSAVSWATRLDADPFQRVSALNLRKVARLEQGDADGAERFRRQAEVLALQMRTPPMFKTFLTVELAAYAKCQDLAGMSQVIEEMRPLSVRYPGWTSNLILAEASFDQVRGDYDAAKTKFEACIELTRPDAEGRSSALAMWIGANAGLAECLIALDRPEEARSTASAALSVCERKTLGVAAFDLVRTLALAEAKLGLAQAAERLDALIAQQNQIGAQGLRMGLSYEARARIAIWTADADAFERFSELTAREYRHGARNSLAVRYERLMNEASRAGLHAKVSLQEFEALAGDTSEIPGDQLLTVITRSMAEHRGSDDRTQLALKMICAAHAATVGHLYLITPAGLVLRASHGAESPARELADRVSSYVSDKLHAADEMDDMVTGDLPDDDTLTSLVQVAGGSYELLPLGCAIDATSMLAGVAVVRVDQTYTRNQKQAQLLNALATSLLQTGDSEGMRLTSATER
jgi:hypothetical protein